MCHGLKTLSKQEKNKYVYCPFGKDRSICIKKIHYETQWTFQREVYDWKKQENLLGFGPYISSKRAGLKHTSSTKWD